MCGRFALTLSPERARYYFGYGETHDFPPRFHIAPTEPIALVIEEKGARRVLLARWGFLPGFVKDVKDFPLLINARAESLADRPSFRAAFLRRRALVMADGFYVQPRAGGDPWLAVSPERGPLALAGLWETYLDASGSEIDTACIVTVPAGPQTARLNPRQPAILPPESFAEWLAGETTPPARAETLLRVAHRTPLELIPAPGAVNRAEDQASQRNT